MNERSDYDGAWKETIEGYLQPFLEFCFPHVARDIDWTAEFHFLDQELQQIVADAEVGMQRVDKLVRVRRRDGPVQWVLLHVEVQSQPDPDLSARLFQYHHRILARFKRPAATLAVLADARPNWRPAPYAADLWGCRVRFEYPACKLLDFGSALLESDPNPVATVIAAHLAVHRTRSSMEGRKRFKRELTWRLYQRGWSRQDIVQLFRLIDWLLRLPDELEAEFRQELMRFEEEHDMPYITSIERLGREEGRQEGLLEGQHEATANLLVRQSRKRFPEFTAQDQTAIRQLPLASLESLGEAFLDFTSIEELRQWLARSLRA